MTTFDGSSMEGEDPAWPQDQIETKVNCRMRRAGEMIVQKEEFPPHYLSNTKAGRTNVNFNIEKRKNRT